MKQNRISYTLNARNLRSAIVNIHVNYLHLLQEKMIEEALAKSDFKEAKEVIQYIMEKK